MRTDQFEKLLKEHCMFEKESVEAAYIKYAHEMRRFDMPDKQIIQMLTELYQKARNDVIYGE